MGAMGPATPNPILRYGVMRLRWCGLSLKAFIARWGAYLLVTGFVLSAGASGWEQVLQAIAAALVLPLCSASQHGWLLVPAALAQAVAGAAVAWGARSLLWSPHWADSERALPLSRAETARSDLLVVLLALTPLLLLYVAGTASVLAHRPAWLRPTHGRALAALALAALSSVAISVALLQWQRGHRAGSRATRRNDASALPGVTRSGAMSPPHALMRLTLWRGPARRTGATLLGGCGSLVLAAAMPAILGWPAGWTWLLAAWSTIALLAATRINHLAHLELDEMLQACSVFPINLRRLRRMQSALALLPLLPGLAGVAIAMAAAPPAGLRPAVLLSWAVACVVACVIEVFSARQTAVDKSARWWFSLIVCICLASEVLA